MSAELGQGEPEAREILLPHEWEPRKYQLPLWSALECGVKRATAVWHRRAGKDLTSLHWTVREQARRPGLYWHVLPTYAQGRKIVWNGMTKIGTPFRDAFPEELVLRERDDDMTMWLQGGSIWQVVGTDDVDKLVGANPIGCVFSEYSLQNAQAWSYIRPILAENDGWALFIYTPRGRNHGHKLYEMSLENEDWFGQSLSVMDTHALHKPGEDLTAEPAAVAAERKAGMPEELIQQEFYCSFDAPLVGAYYGPHLVGLRNKGQITNVPYDPRIPVTTAWDLGIADSTVIWFAQQVAKETRIIECYRASGVGLDHYAKILKERPYAYDEHFVPHDAAVTELGPGKSRVETLAELGVRVTVLPRLPVSDGIDAVRMLLPRCWFDQKGCATGLEALRQYIKEAVEGEQGPNGEPVYRDKPKKDWTSDYADAFRYLAMGWSDQSWGSSTLVQPSTKWIV